MTQQKQVEYDRNTHHLGDWEQVGSYLGRYYGPDGDELGEIPISIAPMLDAYTHDVLGWVVAETPDEDTIFHDACADEDEARQYAEDLAEDLDETPKLPDVISAIAEAGYFDRPEIIPDLVNAMVGHSQGYILVTPDMRHPVGSRWTTNGYLQCDHIQAPATFGSQEQAAEWLLRVLDPAEFE